MFGVIIVSTTSHMWLYSFCFFFFILTYYINTMDLTALYPWHWTASCGNAPVLFTEGTWCSGGLWGHQLRCCQTTNWAPGCIHGYFQNLLNIEPPAKSWSSSRRCRYKSSCFLRYVVGLLSSAVIGYGLQNHESRFRCSHHDKVRTVIFIGTP